MSAPCEFLGVSQAVFMRLPKNVKEAVMLLDIMGRTRINCIQNLSIWIGWYTSNSPLFTHKWTLLELYESLRLVEPCLKKLKCCPSSTFESLYAQFKGSADAVLIGSLSSGNTAVVGVPNGIITSMLTKIGIRLGCRGTIATMVGGLVVTVLLGLAAYGVSDVAGDRAWDNSIKPYICRIRSCR